MRIQLVCIHTEKLFLSTPSFRNKAQSIAHEIVSFPANEIQTM